MHISSISLLFLSSNQIVQQRWTVLIAKHCDCRLAEFTQNISPKVVPCDTAGCILLVKWLFNEHFEALRILRQSGAVKWENWLIKVEFLVLFQILYHKLLTDYFFNVKPIKNFHTSQKSGKFYNIWYAMSKRFECYVYI